MAIACTLCAAHTAALLQAAAHQAAKSCLGRHVDELDTMAGRCMAGVVEEAVRLCPGLAHGTLQALSVNYTLLRQPHKCTR